MIHVKEMMRDEDLKNSKSNDKGSRSRSQSMNVQIHYKQDNIKQEPHRIKSFKGNVESQRAHEIPPMLEKGNYIPWESSSSYSHSSQQYYVTHPSLVVDYKEDYQGDSQVDKLTTTMILARAITQKFSTPTNNCHRTSSNIRNQDVIQDGRVDIQTKNARHGENGHYARDCQKPRVCDAKYFREQMLLAMKDEAGSNLKDEENDFILDNFYEDETLEEINAEVIMMARIQPTNDNIVTEPNYDAKAISELGKKPFKEQKNQYLEDIVDLEEKLSSHDQIVYKIGQSIQTIYMLEKTPNKVYDPFLKVGLGYQNPEHLKKAIAAQPKMYHGEMLQSTKLKIDSEKTLEDAEESRLKMRKK
nr:hypothetical protein [Tanacetum cinerariifolium]